MGKGEVNSSGFSDGRIGKEPKNKIGKTKAVKITLQEDAWAWIDDYIKRGEVTSYSEFWRHVFEGKIRPYNERMWK
jgi:hypothetical protein